MASKALASTALLISLNLLFFTLVASTHVPCPPPPKSPKPPKPTPSPAKPSCPPPPKSPKPPKPTPSPAKPSCPPPPKSPKPPKPTPSPAKPSCPKDTLKLGVCADVLKSLLNISVGTPPKTPCCSLIEGLVDLEAAACLCTAIKANVLGINLNVPVSLSLLLNYCGKKVPHGFQCA